ncbi:putative lipase/esterase [Gordonia spumicola]|uniref:Putative lipase/esterase n=1 Tax=Gordonia spumicola TaxID=589161 RepID=A0A7I9VFG1_9ACTN|nr:alpha/beta hydrolase [Gordonia spumicola]GED99556.1 putative lipase/esterase [Gordonia spumicola]GED99952.1 putative lipase/esterase [Gordonia spumicola]GEE04097.1 putative lipase/esterase [Gordonia spumicola]
MALTVEAILGLLDEPSRGYAETLLTNAPPPPYHRYGPSMMRAVFDAKGVPESTSKGLVTSESIVEKDGTRVPVRCYREVLDTPAPALLYMHGGGFVLGTLDGVDSLCRRLAETTGCVVVSVDYRRAPEHVYPAAADDCLAVYDWMLTDHERLGIDPDRVALAGDSAGGALALSVCTSLQQAGRGLPRCLVLAYPATSASFRGASWEAFALAPVLCRSDAEWFWDSYAGPEVRDDPRAVPEVSAELGSLPPLLVLGAEVDVLRSDYERFVEMVNAAGADALLRTTPGVLHGFITEVDAVPAAREALEDAAAFVRRFTRLDP